MINFSIKYNLICLPILTELRDRRRSNSNQREARDLGGFSVVFVVVVVFDADTDDQSMAMIENDDDSSAGVLPSSPSFDSIFHSFKSQKHC